MGTLAYDPARLQLLASALVGAADALDAIHSSDPDGQPALGATGAASETFRVWAHWALDLAACNVLEGYTPTAIDDENLDLAVAWVVVHGYGWRATTDPLGTTFGAPTIQQAAALGRVLSNGLPPFDSEEDRARLRGQLATVTSDPAALAALRANLDTEGLAALADMLLLEQSAQRQADQIPCLPVGFRPVSAEVRQIDEILASLAIVVFDSSTALGDARARLDAMRPYTAAAVLAHLRAPEGTYVALATDAFTRYATAGDDESARLGEYGDPFTPGIGDLILPRITALSPAAANRFAAAVATVGPELLVAAANDPSVSAGLLAHATDPAAIGEHEAGQVIVPVVDYLNARPDVHEVPITTTSFDATEGVVAQLGTVLAPWMFTMLRDREGAFTWTDAERDDALLFVFADDRSRDDLLAATDRWLESTPAPEPPKDVAELNQRLSAASGALGELLGLIEDHVESEAEAAKARWDLGINVVFRGLGLAVGFIPVVGTGGRIALNTAAWAATKVVTANGSVEAAVRESQRSTDAAMATAGYVGMVAMRALLIANGSIPADTDEVRAPWDEDACPSGDYEAGSQRWVEQHIPREYWSDMDGARHQFINHGGGRLACERLDQD